MSLGFSEMLFIVFIALLIFGPRKLPEIGRQFGKFMSEFKRASSDFQFQLEDEVRKLESDEMAKKYAGVDKAVEEAEKAGDAEPSGGTTATASPELAALHDEMLKGFDPKPPAGTVASGEAAAEEASQQEPKRVM